MCKISRKFGTNDSKPGARIYCTNIDRNLYILGKTHRNLEGNVLVFAKKVRKTLILERIVGKLVTRLTDIIKRGIDTSSSLVRFRRRNYSANKFGVLFFILSSEEIKL